MIKMIVSDMDGTLLNKDLKISQKNLDAIDYIRSKGIRFCVATGRPEQLVKEYINDLQMEDPMILYNGSVITHPFKEGKLFELKLSENQIRDIVTICEQHNVIYMLYTKDRIISKPNYRVDFFEERNKSLPLKEKCVFEDIRDIELLVKEDVNKILIIEQDEEKFELVKNEFMSRTDLNVASSQKGFIDCNPKGASKGNALKVLCEHFGYSLDEVIVFGDQDNDVSMMKIAGTSVCMLNGSYLAKKHSDDITLSNNDSGFAYWINNNVK